MPVFFGFITGFVASIPLGPISILVINRTLQGKFKKMLYFSASIMLIDMILAAAILFGLAEMFREESVQKLILLIGSLVILIFAIWMIRKPVSLETEAAEQKVDGNKGVKAFVSGLLFCAGNLNLIPSWIVFLSYIIAIEEAVPYISFSETNLDKVIFSIFCGVGTYAWYLLLIRFFHKKRNLFNHNILKKINLYTGLVLIILAIYWLLSLVF